MRMCMCTRFTSLDAYKGQTKHYKNMGRRQLRGVFAGACKHLSKRGMNPRGPVGTSAPRTARISHATAAATGANASSLARATEGPNQQNSVEAVTSHLADGVKPPRATKLGLEEDVYKSQ
jgi:hypothetical protein